MLCVRAPPSHHDSHEYAWPPKVCGEGAPTELLDPSRTVVVNGDSCVCELSVRSSPGGFESRVRSTVLGSSSTLVEAVAPLESVAVSSSSRKEGYSWSGALKNHGTVSSKLWIWWVWQLDGQWCMIRRQSSAEAGSGPS